MHNTLDAVYLDFFWEIKIRTNVCTVLFRFLNTLRLYELLIPLPHKGIGHFYIYIYINFINIYIYIYIYIVKFLFFMF